MLKGLANIIEKRPFVVIIILLLITIGFATFIPQIEMKTEFTDFMPEEEVVKANDRINEKFGQYVQTMFLYIEKENSESILSTDTIKELNFINKKLNENKYINNTIGVITFIDQICQMEFGKTLDNCSNEEIKIALDDIISNKIGEKTKIFENDDPNEEIDFYTFPKLKLGKSVDSLDIKNSYAEYTNETVNFYIEIYNIDDFESEIIPPLNQINVFEYYIDFKNKLPLFEGLDIDYKIALHIEPKHSLWTYGDGILDNIKNIIEIIKSKELFSYEESIYLWLKPPGQEMYFPIPLNSGNISLDKTNNQIKLKISREELGSYGIATSIGSFQIPAKLGDFSIGSRYFENPIGKKWQRTNINTSSFFSKIEKRPIIKNIANKIFTKFTNGQISFDDFDESEISMSDKIALKDIEDSWIDIDIINQTNDDYILFIRPNFFNDLKIGLSGFISPDFEEDNPIYSLIILELKSVQGFEKIIEINNQIIDEIEELDSKYDYVKIKATGEGVISSDINKVTSEANQFLGPGIFIIIFIILLINFRKISYVILPMLTLLISTIWLFGTLVILGMDFSVMQVALVPLIMGLGVDYAVHLFHNYRVELEKGKKPNEAIKISITEIGNAMFLAMLTTVIAFMSFLSASVPAIKDFGILLGLGVIYTFITAITLLPAIRYLLDRKKDDFVPKKQRKIDVSIFMKKVSGFILKRNKIILVIMIVLTVFFAYNAINLETGFDLENFAPSDTPSIQLFEDIAINFPSSSQTQELILIEGDVASVDTLKGIYETHKNFEDDDYIAKNPDGSLKTSSIYNIIKNSVQKNNSLIDKYNINKDTYIPKTDQDVEELFNYLYNLESTNFENFDINNFELNDISELEKQNIDFDNTAILVKNVLHKNENGKYDATLIRVFISLSIQNNDNKIDNTLEFITDQFTEDMTDYGDSKATLTGESTITLKITDSLTDSQVISTGISIILALLVLIIAYKNPLLGLVALLPIGITMIWILGTMYLIGYTLNALTITITSITIGIGIDYSIHATERFRLVADKTGDIEKAMCETISHTGGALLIAALTTACGFGILAFAPIPPQQQFGVILSITIVFSLLTSILILPSILVRWAQWRRKIKGYIVTTNGLKKVDGKWIKIDSEKKDKDDYCQ